MSKIRNSNVLATIEFVKERGGRVLDVINGGKHVKLKVVTQSGNTLLMLVSKGPHDPYKLKGWTRQELNRADAKALRTS